MATRTNWLALLVSALAGVALGWLWYGMLFMHQWMDGNGFAMTADGGMTHNGTVVPMDMTPMVCNLVAMLVYAYIINWILQRTSMTTAAGGAQLGFAIGVMAMVGAFIGNMFAMRPMSLSWVDGGYVLVLFTLIGTIVGGWQKKG